MRPVILLFLLLTCARGAIAASNSDIVNERPTVSHLEREAHWQVDCPASWAQLASSSIDQCQIGQELKRSLQFCAFIYQPPGEEPHSICPDYQGALQRLELPCPEIHSWIETHSGCQNDRNGHQNSY